MAFLEGRKPCNDHEPARCCKWHAYVYLASKNMRHEIYRGWENDSDPCEVIEWLESGNQRLLFGGARKISLASFYKWITVSAKICLFCCFESQGISSPSSPCFPSGPSRPSMELCRELWMLIATAGLRENSLFSHRDLWEINLAASCCLHGRWTMKEALQRTGLRYSSKKDIVYVSWNQQRHPSAWWIPPLADGNAYVVWGCIEGKCTKWNQTHQKASFCEVLCTSSSWQRAQHFAGDTSVDITQILPLCCRLGWAQEGAVSSGTSSSTTWGCTMPWGEHPLGNKRCLVAQLSLGTLQSTEPSLSTWPHLRVFASAV